MTSFAVRTIEVGTHVRVQVFAGPDEQHRALTGTLTMRPEEWQDFRRAYPMTEARR